MKVLVTGGAGFLGRYIVEKLLESGDEVSIFSRGSYPEMEEMGVEVIRGDLRNKDEVFGAIEGKEMVFHVASKIDMWGKKKDFYDINVKGTQNVINACLKHGIKKLIYTSTASVVFNGEDIENLDETQPYTKKFLSYYPETKAEAEKLILEANEKMGLKTTILRPHLIWGPRDPSLFPRLIEVAKKKRLPIIGSGKNRLDLTYVENVADAHILAADSPNSAGQIYFISQGELVVPWDFLQELFQGIGVPPIKRKISFRTAYIGGAILEFIFKLFRITKKKPLITRFLASELAHSQYYNISKAKKELGYSPKISIKDGMKKYIEYYLSNNSGGNK